MIMPLLSVTAIGVAGGLLAWVSRRRSATVVAVAIVAAWIGFLCGGAIGVTIDVVAGSGTWLAVLGHAGAAAGTAIGVARTHSSARS